MLLDFLNSILYFDTKKVCTFSSDVIVTKTMTQVENKLERLSLLSQVQ
jgi:hypothetical protein